MSLYKNREKFNNLSIKIGILFSKFRLSPNKWTFITLLPALISVYFLANNMFLYAALFFGIAAFLDLVDGSVARVTGNVTKKGAYLDTIVDRYVEFFIIIGLLLASLPGFMLPIYIWLFLYLFGSMMTTYAKAAYKEKELGDKEISGGLLERAERLVVLFVGIAIAPISTLYLSYIIILLSILSNITSVQRIFIALKSAVK